MAYHTLRFRFGIAFRRWSKKAAIMKVKDGFNQTVFYYSIRRFTRLMNQFELIEKRPVGLFIPPSYLEKFIKNRSWLFAFLNKMEKKSGGASAFSGFADHCYLLLKKK
jgi:hypothetical protein